MIIKKHGFTLLEMSIVVTIIALLMSAVLVGRNFINNARINSSMTELDYYIKSIKLFQEKYTALPGDMPTAATVLTGATNGDGNGKIVSTYTSNPDEMYQAWYQLSLAELIEGRYSGSGASWAVSPGANVPASRSGIAKNICGWLVFYLGYLSSHSEFFDGNYGHVMMIAASGRSASEAAAVFTPDELMELDNKFDDAAASTGNIRGTKNDTDGFVSACVSGTAYNTATETISCAPVFLTGF